LIYDGLIAFAKRVSSSILQIILYLTVVLFMFSALFKKAFSWVQILAFVAGCLVMAITAYFSLTALPKLIPRIARNSNKFLKDAISVMYAASAALGFFVISAVVLGLVISYKYLGLDSMIGYALGVILASFFLRIGGGIFKAGADIAADIVSEVEPDIPVSDKRNPATILDIVGDGVGDVVGFGADILGSFVFAVISCILFSHSLNGARYIDISTANKLMMLPLYIVIVGLLVSFASYLFCKFRMRSRNVDNILLEGIYLAVILCGIATYFVIEVLGLNIGSIVLLGKSQLFLPFPAYLAGLFGSVLIAFTSEFVTSYKYRPAKTIAREVEYGPVVTLLNGLTIGLKSNGFFLLYVVLVTAVAYFFAGFYGIGLAAMGMLSVTSLILSVNIFTHLAANTAKIVKLDDKSNELLIKNVTRMDKIGNNAAAISNAFASGVTVLATFSLFFSLVMISRIDLTYLLLVDMQLVLGVIIGVSIPFVFSGFLLRGLVKVVIYTITEVIRQFREIPFLKEGKANPDVIMAADKCACIAMNALIVPGILMAFVPVMIGYVFGVKILMGFAFGTFLASFNQGFYWANFGDALHNTKHVIASGHYGGKDSVTFKHALTADNIGDAYKDLLSPAINILLKSVVIISILVIMLLNF
jgi:K(+)-stimulated pyrophosphate-energized sodium pump